jgi:N-acetylmuramoyl-L-alanine amidase
MLTRSTDNFISLQGRVDFANTRKADLFISIHNNASANKSSNGTETFYYTSQSLGLAQQIHRELKSATGLTNRGVSSARFFVIRKTWMPSVLLEVAFVTNAREEGLLNSDEWCQRVVDGVTRGVNNYAQTYGKRRAN